MNTARIIKQSGSVLLLLMSSVLVHAQETGCPPATGKHLPGNPVSHCVFSQSQAAIDPGYYQSGENPFRGD